MVTPGRVAYLRCDGVAQLEGAHPCGREPALETAVWAVLATLPRCDDPPPGLGATDLRLDLSPETPTDVHARDVAGAPSLDSHKLLACLAGPLSHVRSTSHATRLVVSFRFALEGR